MKKQLSFSKIKFDELNKIVKLIGIPDIYDTKFQEWFSYSYVLTKTELTLLERLLSQHKLYVSNYSEEELKAKLIIPILNLVEFNCGGIKDWYERPLKAIINGVEIAGYVDFMVATGIKEPQRPYFFIQEFKKSKAKIDPEDQLLAELLVAIELTQSTIMRGAYIIGKTWNFVILERQQTYQYQYYISRVLDNTWFEDLKQIYINLQAIKNLYCNG
jgi:hypothetical protein